MTQPPSPAKLLEIATAFQRSKTLFALVSLEIPTLLAGGPRSVDEIAKKLGADLLAIDRMLNAGVALGLLVREGDGFRNALDAQHFLVRGTETYLGDAFSRYDRVSSLAEWAEFAQRLRSWRAGTTKDRISMVAAPVGEEIEGQHRLSLLAGEALARALELSRHRRLLDLGGGTGAMSIALCRRFPALHSVVLELPAIVPLAQARVRDSGFDDRIAVREGDFVTGPLPDGCDVVLLANVLSMLSASASQALLSRVFERLPAGGIVLLSGWMLDGNRTGPLVPVLFCLEDILLGAPDVERSTATYAEWLAEAGFAGIEQAMYFEPTRFVVGRKPGELPE
ncbi:MAG TPA: methyltransferase [Candidatus Limnocylindria bacterium]|nr:methyltransferase [Candidatus Limnocylindria bacterium]